MRSSFCRLALSILLIAGCTQQLRVAGSNVNSNGSDDPADRDLRSMYARHYDPTESLALLHKIDDEADAPGTYRNNPRAWKDHQTAVYDARMYLAEYAENQKDYAAARGWYQKAISVTDTGTVGAYAKLANLYEKGLGGPRDHQKYEELMAMTGGITSDARAKREAEAAAAAAASQRALQEQERYNATHPVQHARAQCLEACRSNSYSCESQNSSNNMMGIATSGLSLGTAMRNSMSNTDCNWQYRSCTANCR